MRRKKVRIVKSLGIGDGASPQVWPLEAWRTTRAVFIMTCWLSLNDNEMSISEKRRCSGKSI
ncbi:hypothetical protein O9993_09905 [Vibrio lentus]|nr:hypothetical protein [Vibrio lentus]